MIKVDGVINSAVVVDFGEKGRKRVYTKNKENSKHFDRNGIAWGPKLRKRSQQFEGHLFFLALSKSIPNPFSDTPPSDIQSIQNPFSDTAPSDDNVDVTMEESPTISI